MSDSMTQSRETRETWEQHRGRQGPRVPRTRLLPRWASLTVLVLAAVVALSLSYLALSSVDTREHEGFPVRTEEPAPAVELPAEQPPAEQPPAEQLPAEQPPPAVAPPAAP